MIQTDSSRVAVEDLDSLIADLETEYTQVREFTVDAMPPTNNCTGETLTQSTCCKTF